jgi:hypothetical protein
VVAALIAAAALAASPATYVESRQSAEGGFGEPGSAPTPGLTSWAALGLAAAGRPNAGASSYLHAHEEELRTATDVELAVIAQAVSKGVVSDALRARLASLVRPDGRIGPAINSTAWGVAGSPARRRTRTTPRR